MSFVQSLLYCKLVHFQHFWPADLLQMFVKFDFGQILLVVNWLHFVSVEIFKAQQNTTGTGNWTRLLN